MSLAILMVMSVSFSSCSKDDDKGGGNKDFSKLLIGKWQYYAYVEDGWNMVENGGYIQFNSDGSLSLYQDFKTWELTGKGSSSYNEYGDSYKVTLKGSQDRDDTVWDIGIIGKSIAYPMGNYDYPDVLSVTIGYRQYMYVRAK